MGASRDPSEVWGLHCAEDEKKVPYLKVLLFLKRLTDNNIYLYIIQTIFAFYYNIYIIINIIIVFIIILLSLVIVILLYIL